MKQSILITGIAGSGKSTVCAQLQKLGYEAHDIEGISGLFKMINKKTGKISQNHDNDDLGSVMQGDWICNIEKLKFLISSQRQNIAFYCGVASNIGELISLFDMVIMLSIPPDVIRQRLSQRRAGEFGNTTEAQNWILSWKDWWEDSVNEQGVLVVDASSSVDKTVHKILQNTGVK